MPLVVEGYSELIRALRRTDLETRRSVKQVLGEAGEAVRSDAAVRFAPISVKTAAGYRSKVLTRGVFVGQSLRKTTGRHPEYGELQMRRALLPAAAANQARTEAAFERALDRVCNNFDKG